MHFFSKLFVLLAAFMAVAPALASPAPMSPTRVEETSLTKRQGGIVIPACVDVNLNLPISDALRTLRTQLQANATATQNEIDAQRARCSGLLGAVLCGVGGLVTGLLDGLTSTLGTVLGLVDSVTTLIGLNLNLNLGALCLCLEADALTPDSLLRVQTAISGTGLLGSIGSLLGNLVDILQPLLLQIVQNKRQEIGQCPAPANSTPKPFANPQCVSGCPGFTCNSGFVLSTDGNSCVSLDASGNVASKRSIKERSRFACRQPFTACPVSHFLARDSTASGVGFECVDTTSNLESCGGCLNPFKGNAAGQDCTAIANVDTVSCTSGQCIVESCAPGFLPSADFTACEKRSTLSRSGSKRMTLQSRRARK